MLPSQNRLTKDKDFERVFKTGRSSYDKITGMKMLANGLDCSRFGILAGIKVSKKAVQRNKIKRKIRDAIRRELPRIKPGYDCVIIALPMSAETDFDNIKKSLNFHFTRLRLYSK